MPATRCTGRRTPTTASANRRSCATHCACSTSSAGAIPKAATRGDADALSVRIKGALARTGDNGAAEDIAKRAKGTSEQPCSRTGDDDDDERTAAINALLQMNAESAVPILKQVLAKRDACSAGLREKAVFLLSQKRTAETEDIMLGVVKNDPSREVRKKAVFWLGQVNTDKAAAALEQMLPVQHGGRRDARAGRVRPHAAALGARPGRGARDRPGPEGAGRACARRRCSGSASSSRRRTRRSCAGCSTSSPAAPEGSSAESIRKKILFSLSQMRGEGNDKWLMDVAAEFEVLRRDAQAGDLQRGAGGRDDGGSRRRSTRSSPIASSRGSSSGCCRRSAIPRPSTG